jgi:hypothetical protein
MVEIAFVEFETRVWFELNKIAADIFNAGTQGLQIAPGASKIDDSLRRNLMDKFRDLE